jgi:metal transporter CNNM
MQSLCGTAWLPLVLSIVAVAVFAELLPQYIIPRNAIFWAYYCWPFIWGCMWLTCIISWPVSFILDRIAWPCVNRGIYTSEQLGVLIKFHERAERHGGHLGPDAGRIIRGALDLDGRLIQGTNPTYCDKGKAPEADLERGNPTKYDIIVPWTAVRLININEEVTVGFIAKVRGWAYSRIPVVGDDTVTACNAPAEPERSWKGQKVYGFLHVKV